MRESIIQEKLYTRELEALNLDFDSDFLADMMKKDPLFTDENGVFDSESWNNFVNDENQDMEHLVRADEQCA